MANIQWKYRLTEDIVKVEVWDIVDKGKPKKSGALKIDQDREQEMCLDASFLDVYKGGPTPTIVLIIL